MCARCVSLESPSGSVARAYGTSQITPAGGKGPHRPATFVIDKSGHIRWAFHGKTAQDRATIEQLDSALSKLKRAIPLKVGSPASDFSLTEADGKTTFTLSDYRGRKNVLATLLLQTY